MNKVYSIVISKHRAKTPEVGSFLKSIFKYTWRLASNKYNETWLCGRENHANIDDLISSIKHLNKRITGVFITRVTLEEACFDKDGYFDEPEKIDDAKYKICPGSTKMINILMNNINE